MTTEIRTITGNVVTDPELHFTNVCRQFGITEGLQRGN